MTNAKHIPIEDQIREIQRDILRLQSRRTGARIRPEIMAALLHGDRSGIDSRQIIRDKLLIHKRKK